MAAFTLKTRKSNHYLPFWRISLLLILSFSFFPFSQAYGNEKILDLLGKNAHGTSFEIGLWKLEESQHSENEILFVFSHPEQKRLTVKLETRDDSSSAFGSSPSFNILYLGDHHDSRDEARISSLMNEVVRRIARNDKGKINLPRRSEGQKKADEKEYTDKLIGSRLPVGAPAWLQPEVWKLLEASERASAFLLLLMSLFGLLFLVPVFLQFLNGLSSRERRIIGILLLAALAIRLAVPHRLVMAYGGYHIIEQAIHFTRLERYGAGAFTFYNLLLRFIPGEGDAYLAINTVCGFLSLPLAAMWAARYFKLPRLGVSYLGLLAVLPLLIKDHNSESILIPTLFFFFAGLNHWESFRRKGDIASLAFALASFAFTMYCRPSFLFLAPITIAILEMKRQVPEKPKAFLNKTVRGIGLGIIFLLPKLFVLIVFLFIEQNINRSGGLSGVVSGFTSYVFLKNLFINPKATPIIYFLLWIPAFFTEKRSERLNIIRVFLVGYVFFAIFFFDMSPPSLPRLQIPAIFFFTMISAAGLVELLDRRRLRSRPIYFTLLSIAISIPVFYIPCAGIWETTNDQEEQRALETVAEKLPDSDIVLARLTNEDRPETWGIFRDYPDYLFSPPRRNDRLLSLTTWLGRYGSGGFKHPSYIYLGMRCYSIVADRKPGDIGDDYTHPACKTIGEKVILSPVWEKQAINNRAYRDFIWYPDRPTLTIGLYRAEGLK